MVLAAVSAAAIFLAMFAGSVSAQPGPGRGNGKQLGKHDRGLIAEARANGKDTVTLLIATDRGQARRVSSALGALGASVVVVDNDVDYVRAIVPINQADAAAAISGVLSADVDEIIPLDDPRPEGTVNPTAQTPPGPATPNVNPYMPTGDTGAAQFAAAHPTWDGRGTVIGILDSGITLDHPSLQTTSTGDRKIIEWVTATHPTDDDDPTWVDMKDQVSGAAFSYGTPTAVAYTAPAAGSYRIGLFNERDTRLGGETGTDMNRDGNPAGSSGIFAVLWRTSDNTVWVDTNQNNSFADEVAMKDYNVAFDVNYFGTDNPATPVAERMPFVIQTDGQNKFVNIGIVSGAHGSHVAGIAAGNNLFGGAMDGAAPGAQIKSVRVCLFIAGCTAHALIEGMIFVAKQGNVDVINMSIGGLPALNDGNNTRTILYDRLIEQFSVQIVISAGNSGAGLNTVGDPSVAGKVVSVGSYITDESWRKNYGSDSTHPDNMHGFSSRGPREDGGFKPNVVAPGSAISTTPVWQVGGPVAGTYDLPPGYAMFNGTSMASPQTAGAIALLISASEANGNQKQPAQLRQALYSSARFVDPGRIGAYEQGNGLIDVDAAWDLLKTNLKPVEIVSSVPVKTAITQFLATPNVGQGIHDREGVVAGGAPYTRTYTFTRTRGGGGNKTYNLSWVGNDGTFSLPATSISLGLNSPRTLVVGINPATAGAHSAILELDDPATAGVDYQTMNVVVAAEEFSAAGNYSQVKTGTIEQNQVLSYFFRVPAGTPAFKVDFSGPSATPGTGQARFLRFHPYGVTIEPSNNSLTCYSPPVAGGSTCNPLSRTTSNPQAGVWEVVVEARRTSDAASTPFTLVASILGATVSPNPDIIASATLGVPVARSYTLTNLFGAFTGRAVGTNLGSAFRATPIIAHLAQQEYFVTVDAGSTSLRATIGSPSDPAADLDLFVYRCPTPTTCVLAGQNADGDSEESVTIANPAAGVWKVVVDGFDVPAGTTTYKYVDVFANAAFGSVSVTDANALRPAGSSWTVPGSVTAAAAPAAGRVLLGNVQVRTDSNVLVGQGDVVVESVTP